MRMLCETVGPASRNGNPARRSWAREGNKSVGRRMEHFICKFSLLATLGTLAVARKHINLHSLPAVSGATQWLSPPQLPFDSALCANASECSSKCCDRSVWPLPCQLLSNVSSGSQPVLLRALICAGSANCCVDTRPTTWQSEAVAGGDPERQRDVLRPRGLWLWRRHVPPVAASKRTQTTRFTSRALMQLPVLGPILRLPRIRGLCLRRVPRRPRLRGRWGGWDQDRYRLLQRSQCLLFPHRTRRLQLSQLLWRLLHRPAQPRSSRRALQPLTWVWRQTRDLGCQSPYHTPSSTTSTSSSERIPELVWTLPLIDTQARAQCSGSFAEPLRLQKMPFLPELSCIDQLVLSTNMSVYRVFICQTSGPPSVMGLETAPTQPTAGCQVCLAGSRLQPSFLRPPYG